LNERQVEYIDLQSWGYLNPGFKGSAVISATFWEHDVFDGQGRFLRNLVGLGAVTVERTGTILGEDVPGDESAGSRGIPFRIDEDAGFGFDFEGPIQPFCPGQPGSRPDPLACPDAVTVACQDCPLPVLDIQTVSSFLNVTAQQAPNGCQIEDVNVLLDITHTFNNDLVLDLSSPSQSDIGLFSRICGADDNIQALLDDDAAQPIGSVCPPAGFQTVNTAPPGNLTLFEGSSAAGTWKLDIADVVGGDAGTLHNWELQFQLGD
jgi:subtilisin-like proprotein convertase family protein